MQELEYVIGVLKLGTKLLKSRYTNNDDSRK